jgi:hypothetical protein
MAGWFFPLEFDFFEKCPPRFRSRKLFLKKETNDEVVGSSHNPTTKCGVSGIFAFENK